jgi:drug/metabolite transporter (DMT)-like permease
VTAPSPLAGRLLVVAAALLWSLSGAFNNFLNHPTALGLHEPRLDPMQVAVGRVFFAGLVLAPLVRPRDVRFRGVTIATMIAFALMNATYVPALTMGPSGVAVLFQYTAPIWIFLAGIAFLGEKPERRGVVSLIAAFAGMAIILAGSMVEGKDEASKSTVSVWQILLATASGVSFGGIVLGLRAQRGLSSAWLTLVNHLGSALLLLPFALPWVRPDLSWPTWPQVGWLALFGVVQLGGPYLLIAYGLKSVSPQEAGTLTLLEPLLVPVWAHLVAPEKEKMSIFVLVGGALILLGLAYRYWPFPRKSPPPPTGGSLA